MQENFEEAVAWLSQEGILYFQEENDTLKFFIPRSEWTPEKKAAIQGVINEHFGEGILWREEDIAEKNWNETYEQTLQPIEISPKLAIVQKERPYEPKPGQMVIEINPKMSFGTGFHETTRLMLRAMEQMALHDETILDIGTGTGVLAIAARKYGNTKPMLAFDNYPWAVENAIENCAINDETGIEVRQMDAEEDLAGLLDKSAYSLILANLNRGVLTNVFPILASHAPGATVLISGILVYDKPWLEELLRTHQWTLKEMTTEGEWLCAKLQKV
jgi:ribosomal protein L11 methyltransferase